MTYQKFTSISGNTEDGGFKCLTPNGHWNIKAAIDRGRKSHIADNMTIEHCVLDMSGHGRSGHDGRWTVTADNIATRVEKWREGSKTARTYS